MKFAIVCLSLFVAVCHADSPGEDLPLGGPFGVCPEEDDQKPVYLLDLKNRFAFYECSNGKPRLQYCTAELVFNPRKDICDYQSDEWEPYGPIGTCPLLNPMFPVFLRDGMSVVVFYMCENGKAKKLECDGELIFDPYTDACIPF